MRAFLVIGPEGSGTYMLWDALASAGCGTAIEPKSELYTVRYSLPHVHEWPHLINIANDLAEHGYRVQPLIILRDWHCTVESVLRRDPDRFDYKVEMNMSHALWKIGQLASNYQNTIYITYEAFCLSEGFRRWFFKSKLGLPEPKIEINFANEKYYDNH